MNAREQLRKQLESPEHQARVREADARRRVIEEALTWLNTPIRSGGRVKGVAADCAFFAEVFRQCKVFDRKPEIYNADWFCHKDRGKYLKAVLEHSKEVEGELAHHPGNIVLGKCLDTYWHGALIVSWPTIIHAYPPRVVSGDIRLLLPFSGAQELRFFSPWGTF